MDSNDIAFAILGLNQFSIDGNIKLNLANLEGCYIIEYSQLNMSVQICQIELIYFLHSSEQPLETLTRGMEDFASKLSRCL
jgi:Zn-finger domain-containing protein